METNKRTYVIQRWIMFEIKEENNQVKATGLSIM